MIEIISDYRGDAYRAVYTVRLAGRIYALHAFQKKAKSGIKTPRAEMDLVRERLSVAEELHTEWIKQRRESVKQ